MPISPSSVLDRGRARAGWEARRLYYRSATLRRVRSALPERARVDPPLDFSHLARYRERDALGPIQRDEAVMLYGLVRTIRASTVVEFGFLDGRSAFNVLQALEPDGRLYSFDISDWSQTLARQLFGHDRRFTFRAKSQDAITPDDVDRRPVDFVFIDGAHDLQINQRTFERLLPLLAPQAIVAVHDTGSCLRRVMPPAHVEHAKINPNGAWLSDDEYEGQRDERAFVNWIRTTKPEFAQIHLHTHAVVRHGITLLQRSQRLPTTVPDSTGVADS